MITRVPETGVLVLNADSESGRPSGAVKSGMNVRADDWNALINTLNYLNADHGTIVPATYPGVNISGTGTKTLRFYSIPRPNCIARLWIVAAVGGSGDSTIEISAPADAVTPNATASIASLLRTGAFSRPPVFAIEEVADPAEQELSIAIECTSSNGAVVYQLTCIELPRRFLGDTADDIGAIQPQTVAPGQRVQNRGTVESVNGGFYSLAGIARAAEYAAVNARRACLFAWATAEEDVTPYTSTDPFEWTLTPVLARKIETAETQRTVIIAMRVEVTGDGGTIDVDVESGDSVTITADGTGVAGDDPPWYFAEIDVDVDDHDNASYGQTGREIGDYITLTLTAITGGSIAITSISVYEKDDVA